MEGCEVDLGTGARSASKSTTRMQDRIDQALEFLTAPPAFLVSCPAQERSV